jgi:hypothetical protein
LGFLGCDRFVIIAKSLEILLQRSNRTGVRCDFFFASSLPA